MTVHEFGDRNNPVIMLFPGTMCHWKGCFGNVIDELSKHFCVAAVAYTGFDESDTEDYVSVTDELERIEKYVKENYGGSIRAAYGCSLGGSFVSHLAARQNIGMKYGIIGSSDMDQAGEVKASILAALVVKMTYNFIHTGEYKSKLMKKRFDEQMKEEYNRAFVAMTGRDKYDMSYITKASMKNQFKSDLVTPLPIQADTGDCEIHVFYAKKMGEEYLARYKKYFKNPVIHEQGMRHEEFLALHPAEWCALVEKICL